jgi:hypothetical protein
MSLYSEESVMMSGTGFSDGIEFEETFPEAVAVTEAGPLRPTQADLDAPAPAATPETPTDTDIATPRASITLAPVAPSFDAAEALFQEQLARRLREAEAMVNQTLERMRVDEEQRLAQWAEERREEEARRLAKWADERRVSIERALEQREANADGLAARVQEMLTEWQNSFERRLDQRRVADERLTEQQRISDIERLQAWRSGLDQALTEQFTQRHSDLAPLPDRSGELRATVRDAVAMATSARDVGRALRDVLAEVAQTAAFALSVHDAEEVAYRYRVAAEDDLGSLLRHDVLDDGPWSAVSFAEGWARAQRTIRVGSRNVTVHTAQLALRAGDATIGVLTLQSEDAALGNSILASVADLAQLATPQLAALRDNGSYRAV